MLRTRLVSHYQLVKILGKGAFGTTYLAKDIQLPGNPQYAIKKLNPNTRDKRLLEVARRLFNAEAHALEKLGKHEQIPRFVANFEQNHQFYLVQEFINGHSLNRELRVGRSWSEYNVIQLLRDCLNILKFIHDRGIIHRDIKPNNFIRREEDNKLVLIDFGAVKEVIGRNQPFSTIGIGTKGYMPPEQARGKPRFNSDIYALGMIALQALIGMKPKNFPRDGNGEIIWLDRTGNINQKLVRIINKMIRVNFQERYRSAEIVLRDLNRLNSHIFLFWPDRSFSGKQNSSQIKLPNNLTYNNQKLLSNSRGNYLSNKISTNNLKFKFIMTASILMLGAIAFLGQMSFKARQERQDLGRSVKFNKLVLTRLF